jgi:hypothetical protein
VEKQARGPRGALFALTPEQAVAEERLLLLAHAEGDEDLHQDLESIWAQLEASTTSRWGGSGGEVLRAYSRAIEHGYLTDGIASREPLAHLPDQMDTMFRGAIAEFDLVVMARLWASLRPSPPYASRFPNVRG